jgi:superfamily II DNA or RNA helicase
VSPSAEDIEQILRSFDRQVVARGRDYAARGLVTHLRHQSREVRAFVHGSQRYEVQLGLHSSGKPFADCTCVAYKRDRQCKHIVALAVTVRGELANGAWKESEASAGNGASKEPEELPAIFKSAYSATKFLERLSLYAGERLVSDADDRYSTVRDWWWQSVQRRSTTGGALRRHVVDHTADIAEVLRTLGQWTPKAPPLPGTAYSAFYARLAQAYDEARTRPRIRSAVPGPLDARHPGFSFSFDKARRSFVAVERPSPVLGAPLRLGVEVPLEPGAALGWRDNAFVANGEIDAWELFTLREMLIALEARTDEGVQQLAAELGRPVWDHILDQLGRPARLPEPREWLFCLVEGYRGLEHKLLAFSRAPSSRPGGRVAKWKKQSFETLLSAGEPDAATGAAQSAEASLEREIARVALCSLVPSLRADVTLMPATPHGHELLRLLARHPRCVIAQGYKPNPETDRTARIFAGMLTMRLERGPEDALVPRFLAGDREIPVPISSLTGASSSVFRGATRADDEGAILVSVQVPPSLRPWLELVARMGDTLSFPSEAVPKLALVTQGLVASGVVQLPREALGEELAYEPSAAIRVEWLYGEGGVALAKVEIMIAVRPHAPFVAPGAGPRLFTYEYQGRRVFVEREREHEGRLALEAISAIVAPLHWRDTEGQTSCVEETILLGEYLDQNPLGLPIEVKVGRSPTIVQWPENAARLTVTKRGSWLVLDGALDVDGAKLTLGEVLDAARLAQRYVKAGDGVFLELSKEAIAKLQPVAMATELAPLRLPGEPPLAAGEPRGDRLHDAFGSVLAEASTLFDQVRANGTDIAEYTRRFEARERPLRVPPLEHGQLRPYQHDGVSWMLRLAAWAPGCVLADDMGLGKTVQTAAVLKARAKLGPALIIAPASVASNWVIELERFMPSLKVRWFNADRATALDGLGATDVLIVSYGLLQRQSAAFAGRRWATVVVDEAQYVKNVGAQRSDAVRSLERDFTIALTGTPLENHLGELFSIVAIVFPGLLGDEATFRDRFRRPIEGGQRDGDRLVALGRLLGPFLLRRTRAAVLTELPPREEITEYIDLAPEESRRYLALRRACETQFTTRDQEETSAQLRIALFAALTRLRQLACDVRLVDPTFEGASTKISRAVELATQLASEGNRALVFSQFTQFLDKVRTALEAAGLRVAYLTGETPTTKRRAIIDRFQAGEYDVFCVSLLAGGTGLNLTKASYVIHLDPWWNPAAEEQATSRAHRMGQTDPVTVYRLVARGTIEEAVLALHATKRELASAVLEGKAGTTAISSTELLELLRFGA